LISTYYGTCEDDVQPLYKDYGSREKLLRNKLCGDGQNIRSLIVQKMELQIKVIQHFEIESNKQESFSTFSLWN
jgi:hypothetical protein